ncbi:hypothetical protein, partial [Haliea atlantica]
MIFSTFFYCGLYPGKTMNNPPKQRKDDPKEAPHFRTHRIHAINSDWYLVLRHFMWISGSSPQGWQSG